MSYDVTPRSKYQKSKGHPWSRCASNLVQFRLLFTKLRHFEKNGTRHFSLIGRHLESVSRTISVFKQTLAPSEKWPTQEISVRCGPFLSSYRVNIARCNLCARAKVIRSHKAKNRRKHFHGKIGRAISNLVAVLVSDLWAMAGKNGSFFQQLAAILNVPFRPNSGAYTGGGAEGALAPPPPPKLTRAGLN